MSDGWASINSVEAAKLLVREAESPRAAISKPVMAPKAVPKVRTENPVETRTRQQPSLPKLSCLLGDS
jgi:hypothetical protein